MIAVQKAIEITLSETSVLGTETISLLEAQGRILAEDIYSDIDMPPFNKSSMDGFALRAGDTVQAPVTLKVVGFIPAGIYPEFVLASGQAAKIMTGAPLPAGADSVQMVEKTETPENGKVVILESVSSGKHVAPKSEIIQAHSRVISKGRYLSSAVIGVLATVGKVEVKVWQRPTVGILVTGDELVEVHQKPKPGQIRNSNGYVLYHQVRECGALPELFGIAPDDVNKLRNKIQQGLKKDVLIISGGVSMGDLDLVEDVFAQLGVQIFYNKVDIKPGKPTVFGRKDSTLIFGLPGNPVSASTVFEIFVKLAIRKMMGFRQYHNIKLKAVLDKDFTSRTNRQYFPPAWTYFENNTFFTTPLPSKGSADVVAFANSNSYLNIPGEVNEIKKGQGVDVLLRNEFWTTCLNKKA